MEISDNVSRSLLKYCEKLTFDIGERLKESDSIDDSEGKILLALYQDRCKEIVSSLKDLNNKSSDEQISAALKEIAKLVLDITYVVEVRLVDDEFPPEIAETKIKYILESLTELELVVSDIFPEKEVIDCLGSEILECLRWRKGALLFMFCHTVQSHHPGPEFPSCYVHYVEEGIDFLVKMLKTRGDLRWLESAETSSSFNHPPLKDDTLQLIDQGIFSDTHLLALMYCGELCYWYSCLSCKQGTITTESKEEKSKKESIDSKAPAEMTLNEPVVSSSFDPAQKEGSETRMKTERSEKSTSLENGSDSSQDSSHKCFGALSNEKTLSDCKFDEVKEKQFRFVSIGNSCLKLYLKVTKGPLACAGWSASRAEEILLHFNKLKI